MAISSAICNTFKEELMKGGHNFNTSGGTPAGNAFKIALYTSSSTIDSTTTAYGGPSNEISGTGYSAGGNALTNTGVAKSTSTTYTDFSDTSWTSASFTANGCLIYNTTAVTGFTTNRAVCVIAFGGDKTVSSGTFTIQFPTNDSSSAIIRLSGGV